MALASAGHPPAVLTNAADTRLVTGVLTPPLGCGVPPAAAAERLHLGHGALLAVARD